jgi:hypothetical protein
MNLMPAINIVMKPMNLFAGIKAGLRRLALIFLLVLPLAATAVEQRTFATPEAAVDALLAALKAKDEAALTVIFGDRHKEMIASGDAAQNAADRAKAAEALAAFRVLDSRGEDRRVLLMGVNAWPMPIPLVRKGGVWRFATEEGVEELINRRIGGNENSAMVHVPSDAQRQYASIDRDGDGVLLLRTNSPARVANRTDSAGRPIPRARRSPFGPLIAASSAYLKGKQGVIPSRLPFPS